MAEMDMSKWQQLVEKLYVEEKLEKKMQSILDLFAPDMGICMLIVSIDKMYGSHSEWTLYSNGLFTGVEKKHEYQYRVNEYDDVYTFYLYENPKTHFGKKEEQFCEFFTKILYMILDRVHCRKLAQQCKVKDIQSGIGNLNYFFQQGTQLLQQGVLHQYAGIFFNVKNFKLINKLFGIDTGNKAIIDYSKAVAALIWDNEVLARVASDNYIALIDKRHIMDFVRRIEDFPIYIQQDNKRMEYRLSVRAGIYLIEEADDNIGEVMNYLSSALHLAKNNSEMGEIVYYTSELHEKLLQSFQIEAELEPALKNGELVAYYQPKVDLVKKRIVGAEALVRWHKKDSIRYPDSFIPIAEQNGFVCQIDYEILRQTCLHIRKWQEENVTVVPISVNFSKKHLFHNKMAEKIHEIVKQYQVSPSLIEIEFTETAVYGNQENFQNVLKQLKEYGFRTSMDDFGMGSSSFELLQKFLFDVLKIDKSFLAHMKEEKRNQIILKNLVQLAKQLSMGVYCEGVETQEHVEFLKAIDCPYVQGFLFDKPLPPEEFQKKLLKGSYD